MKKHLLLAALPVSMALLAVAGCMRPFGPVPPGPVTTPTPTATPYLGCLDGHSALVGTCTTYLSFPGGLPLPPIPTPTPAPCGFTGSYAWVPPTAAFPGWSPAFGAPVTSTTNPMVTIVRTPGEWTAFWAAETEHPAAPIDFSGEMLVILDFNGGGAGNVSYGLAQVCYPGDRLEVYTSGGGGGAPCGICPSYRAIQVYVVPRSDLPTVYISAFFFGV